MAGPNELSEKCKYLNILFYLPRHRVIFSHRFEATLDESLLLIGHRKNILQDSFCVDQLASGADAARHSVSHTGFSLCSEYVTISIYHSIH
jgi:hypothetical protein